MEFIELKEIVRKDSPIHYINKYKGLLVYKHEEIIKEQIIEIVLEKTAYGTTNMQLNLLDDILKNSTADLEKFINEKHKSGFFD